MTFSDFKQALSRLLPIDNNDKEKDNEFEEAKQELRSNIEKMVNEIQAMPPKPANAYFSKYTTKHRAKNKIKTKFKIGRHYFLRFKPKDGSANVIIEYQCIKTIYSVKDIPLNIVIMKQLTQYPSKKFTLDRYECEKFHIKYQPGLEVWPMEMNWIPEKKDQTQHHLFDK